MRKRPQDEPNCGPGWLKKYATLRAQRIAAFRRGLAQIIRARLEPVSFESVTEWAEANRYLPPTASEPGRYVAERLPYQRGIQDSFGITSVREITFMGAERLGKSTVASNILGFIIDRWPASILWILPNMTAMRDFVTDEIDPMIRQSDRLRRKVAAGFDRHGGANNIRRKTFLGGQVTFVGGGSSTNLAVRTVKYVVIDEADKLKNLPAEGDADSLIAKRVTTFSEAGGVILRFSKPTSEERSRINRHFLRGTQSKWFLECPNPECGQYVHLRWQHIHFEDARGYCEHCNQGFDQETWLKQPGKWRESVPNQAHKSFQLSALFSPFIRWQTLIAEFRDAHDALEAGDPSLMTVFQNSRLGEVSGAFGEYRLEADALYDRRTYFGEAEVPEGIIALTAGIDTQSDGFRWLVCGWGRRNEVWLIETGAIVGDMAAGFNEPGPWRELDAVLSRLWTDKDGNGYRALVSAMDVQGDHYERCLQFVKVNARLGLRGIRGLGADKRKSTAQKASVIRNEYTDKVLHVPIHNIDVDAAKTVVATMLARKESAGPGIVHIPCGVTGEDSRGFDLVTVSEFTAEYRRKKMVAGYPVYTWHKYAHLDNHRLDCLAYCLAASLLTRIDFDTAEPVRVSNEKTQAFREKLAAGLPAQRRRPRVIWGNPWQQSSGY